MICAARASRSAIVRVSVASAIATSGRPVVKIGSAIAAPARQSLDRYRNEILPASLQVEQMAEESYRSGQTGLPVYIQTLQAAREIRQRALQAGLDYQLALADLERAMGIALR